MNRSPSTSAPKPHTEQCPGCGRTIETPDAPTPATWLDGDQWCTNCGGSAPHARRPRMTAGEAAAVAPNPAVALNQGVAR